MNNEPEVPTGASALAIQQHYDLGNEFYRLWLDKEMVYSCALWPDDAPDLELGAAQHEKMRYLAGEARVLGSRSVLDIGCGWGGLLRYLIGEAAVQQVTGLTLSEAQLEWIQAHPSPELTALLESWHTHSPVNPYNAIISVGAFEAFARPEDDSAAKVRIYRKFFDKCHQMLVPFGRLCLQTIAVPDAAPKPSTYLESIFPESQPPRRHEVLEAAEGLFELVRLRNDRPMYARTSRLWAARLKARRAEAEALVGADQVTRYIDYLRACAIGFDLGSHNLLRFTFQRMA